MHLDPSTETLRGLMPTSNAGTSQRRDSDATDLRLSVVRGRSPLRWRSASAPLPDELTLDEIVKAAIAVRETPGSLLLDGGEPLQRSDVWELLEQLARIRSQGLGVCTSGRGLDDAVARRLHSVGVRRVQVPFHCARQDAHDWLVGEPGALKTAHRAIRNCIAAGLQVAAEIVLSRPTMPHLAETVELLARLGVRTIYVRRLTADDVDAPTFVPLSPRLSLLESSLEQAAGVALRRRVRLALRDLPLCVAPRLRAFFAPPDSEGWVLANGVVATRAAAGTGCATCPGSPRCAGAPADYVARFGWQEFANRSVAIERVDETVIDQQAGNASQPMTFTWQGPSRVLCEACADMPSAETGMQPAPEPTRVVRARLVQAALHRPSVLRLVGANLLAHPQSALLIFDALRLFTHVEVAGEAGTMVDWSDLDLRRMKDLKRIDVAVYGPDAASHDAHCAIPGAFAAMQRGVERLRAQTSITVGAYAIVHAASEIPRFAAAWDNGLLPGTPRFRLSAKGSSLEELIDCAQALPLGPARTALLAMLPRCLLPQEADIDPDIAAAFREWHIPQQKIHRGRSLPYNPSGSDSIGAFEACPEGLPACASSGCPGTPVGWHRKQRG